MAILKYQRVVYEPISHWENTTVYIVDGAPHEIFPIFRSELGPWSEADSHLLQGFLGPLKLMVRTAIDHIFWVNYHITPI